MRRGPIEKSDRTGRDRTRARCATQDRFASSQPRPPVLSYSTACENPVLRPFDASVSKLDNLLWGSCVFPGGEMLRNRCLLLLTASLLASSAALADNLGYVDCRNHPEETQVFPKPRRMPDQVASLACGDTFTILQNGFIFSRIQTFDGKVGYVYSNVITPGRGPVSMARPAAVPAPAPASVPATAPASPIQSAPDVNSQPQPAPVQAAPIQPAPATPNIAQAPEKSAQPETVVSATPAASQPPPAPAATNKISPAQANVSADDVNSAKPSPANSAAMQTSAAPTKPSPVETAP